MRNPRSPSLYQINTRVWLTGLSRKLNRPAVLDDIPDADLDRIAEMGFDWVWLLSVWQTGLDAQKISRQRRVAQRLRSDLAGFTRRKMKSLIGNVKIHLRLRRRMTK